MNKPKQKKRHEWRISPTDGPPHGGPFNLALSNPEYALAFAAILSQFEHLESAMATVFAILLVQDYRPAGYVYRNLRSPSLRHRVLLDLLERAPVNVTRGDEFDELLREYDAVRTSRNEYAHGLWFTAHGDGSVYLAKKDEHGLAFLDAKPEPLANMHALVSRSHGLFRRISVIISAEFMKNADPA